MFSSLLGSLSLSTCHLFSVSCVLPRAQGSLGGKCRPLPATPRCVSACATLPTSQRAEAQRPGPEQQVKPGVTPSQGPTVVRRMGNASGYCNLSPGHTRIGVARGSPLLSHPLSTHPEHCQPRAGTAAAMSHSRVARGADTQSQPSLSPHPGSSQRQRVAAGTGQGWRAGGQVDLGCQRGGE